MKKATLTGIRIVLMLGLVTCLVSPVWAQTPATAPVVATAGTPTSAPVAAQAPAPDRPSRAM